MSERIETTQNPSEEMVQVQNAVYQLEIEAGIHHRRGRRNRHLAISAIVLAVAALLANVLHAIPL